MDILLILISMIIVSGASIYLRTTYNKYSNITINRNITGSEIARNILDKHDLKDIYIVETNGFLSDHFDPKRKVIRLSKNIYHDNSIASVAVAAHEVGHAIQDKEKYNFLAIRHSLVPLANFSSYLGYGVVFVGIISSMMNLVYFGIVLLMIVIAFQLVTLPVEFDASKRAYNELKEQNILNEVELIGVNSMLKAAALTYVAAVTSAILEILRLLIVANNRRRD